MNFLIKNNQNCVNFVGVNIILHFLLLFTHFSDLNSPMTKLLKYER